MVDPATGRVNAAAGDEGPAGAPRLDPILAALGYRSDGFRLRRRAVSTRLAARRGELKLGEDEYLALLRSSSAERAVARRLLAGGETRLWRDPELWRLISERVLPVLGAGRPEARVWVAEAGTGLEAMTIALLWATRPDLCRRPIRIVVTDSRPALLERARAGRLPRRAARGLPAELAAALVPAGAELELPAPARSVLHVAVHDLARDPWPMEIDLLVVRNGAFATWGEDLADEAFGRAAESIVSHGHLALGRLDRVTARGALLFAPVLPGIPLLRRRQ